MHSTVSPQGNDGQRPTSGGLLLEERAGANTELLARALRQALQVALALAQHLEWREITDTLFAVFAAVDRRCQP